MRFTRHVSQGLVRTAVNAARAGKQLEMINALYALGEELDRIDAEEAAERERDAARARPALTTQKVLAVLRKAKLDIRHVASGLASVGGATGFDVSYGDWDLRTWVAVEYRFAWDWGHYQKWSDERIHEEERKTRTAKLKAAREALEAAGLTVVRDTRGGISDGWKVTA